MGDLANVLEMGVSQYLKQSPLFTRAQKKLKKNIKNVNLEQFSRFRSFSKSQLKFSRFGAEIVSNLAGHL
jgi:hypothetical protein